MPPPNDQELPSKESNLFKQIVKFYETKQYKKGIKAADQILKKFPEHGETLAMKGLTLNCLLRKEEAYEFVRAGLKRDLRSHVCWHVYGLLYRSDRDYREAIKCYRNALRLDKENIQILRDLSLLQIQMRDLEGFAETRQSLLHLKPNNRNNWIAFAVSQHLNGSLDVAAKILEAYESTLDGVPPTERYEHGEMILYKSEILEEDGKLQESLDNIDRNREQIVDLLSADETSARLLQKVGKLDESQKQYRSLLKRNPDNHRYHFGLHEAMELAAAPGGHTDAQSAKLKELYEGLSAEHKKSSAAQRIPLTFLKGEAFLEAAEAYTYTRLKKGIPSLFADLSELYTDSSKAAAMEALMEGAASQLAKDQTFPFAHPPKPGPPATQPPDLLLWVYFFLAQHYDMRGNPVKAIESIDKAIAHSPTIVDLYLCKARIMGRAGDRQAAWALADEARSMDLADRYLNSECVKVMLQGDQVEKAQETIALFTKEGDDGNTLYDMQCMWYEVEAGNSHLRCEKFGRAIRQYKAVAEHFADITEDQFDFHTYCLRKMTLRTYVKLLRMEERLHNHRFYCQAALGLLRCYMGLNDQEVLPEGAAVEGQGAGKEGEGAGTEGGGAGAEGGGKNKKQRERKRGAEAAQLREREKKEAEQVEKLENVEEPLQELAKPLDLLQVHALDMLETHYLSCEVYLRRGKLMLAFRSVHRLQRLAPDHPLTHHCIVRVIQRVQADQASATGYQADTIKAVLNPQVEAVLGGKSLAEYSAAYLAKHEGDLARTLAAVECSVLVAPKDKPKALKRLLALQTLPCFKACQEPAHLQTGHRLLKECFGDAAAAEQWRHACAAAFPLDTTWQPAAAAA